MKRIPAKQPNSNVFKNQERNLYKDLYRNLYEVLYWNIYGNLYKNLTFNGNGPLFRRKYFQLVANDTNSNSDVLLVQFKQIVNS